MVSLDQLVDRVWGATPPPSARQTLHSYISRLRGVLRDEGGPLLARRSGGYVLAVDESTVDLHRFRALVTRAKQADDDAAALWQDAMSLWRGEPFSGLDSDWLRSVAVRLEAERLAAVLDHNDLLLRCGEHARLVASIEDAARAHPLDERLAGQLMLALYRSGRQADALAHYRMVQQQLADDLGSDPGPALRELYHGILRHDRRLTAPTPVATTAGTALVETALDDAGDQHAGAARGGVTAGADGGVSDASWLGPVPRQLPGFRDHAAVHSRERARALSLLSASDRSSPTVVALNGSGGIGKSALAIDLAHSVKDRYPDGQLFADLRGNVPGHEPLDTGRVVRHFLRSLGYREEPQQDTESDAAHFRSVTADLRVLIVLDDARDAAQVRPLLPNGPGCAVIVTSRQALSSMQGAEHLELPLLDPSAARALFRSGVDHPFAPQDEQVLDGVLDRCGGLPLALCIAAARFNAAEPGSLPEILESLSDEALSLVGFDDGENSLAASLTGSLQALSATPLGSEAVELFTLMALHPGPSVSVEIAAALLDKPVPVVRHLGELLRRYRLVEQHRTGRLTMHDLVRSFAIGEAAKLDRAVTTEATRRMRLAYLAAAAQAYQQFRDNFHKPVGRNRLDFVPDLPATPVHFASPREADEWVIDHLSILDELVRTTDEADKWFPGLLFILLRPPVSTRAGLISELTLIALSAAALLETADEPWAVYLYNDLAELQLATGENAAAIESLDKAEASARAHGRFAEAVGVLATRVRALQGLGELDQALALANEVIDEAKQRGLIDVAARAGAYRSYVLDLLGQHVAAIDQSAQLVAYAEKETEGVTPIRRSAFLINHAFRLVHGGRAAEGLAMAEGARAISVEHGFDSSYNYAEILWGMAEAHQVLGHASTAENLWHEAARLLLANGRIHQTQYEQILAGQRPPIDPAG
ncbi:BTAD domain-containing putative transcriptional regulator [Promicromonospora sp. NPDC057138]|uniref:AfsR/SARP family transcriptional regulator n=1 Tax=Promicromonospora sp. NPDC057138 TaxID=3346031 RepID=UPI00363CD5F0